MIHLSQLLSRFRENDEYQTAVMISRRLPDRCESRRCVAARLSVSAQSNEVKEFRRPASGAKFLQSLIPSCNLIKHQIKSLKINISELTNMQSS
jgi:hypothetical protein